MSGRMYTGETPEEFYARRAPMENLWNGFMAGLRRNEFGANDERERQARAQEADRIGPVCSCYLTPEKTWTRYGSAVEPGSQWEPNPGCIAHFPDQERADDFERNDHD
jgi:hypothetical protein